MTKVMKFELVKNVPVVDIDGKKCIVDTGNSISFFSLSDAAQEFFGASAIVGLAGLSRYTKFDYANSEITTSDEPIPLEDGVVVPLDSMYGVPAVNVTIAGVNIKPFLDSGAGYSYQYNLPKDYPIVGTIEDCDATGNKWQASIQRVPFEIAGHSIKIVCARAEDCHWQGGDNNLPQNGVLGYDFFKNFTIVIDRIDLQMTLVKA